MNGRDHAVARGRPSNSARPADALYQNIAFHIYKARPRSEFQAYAEVEPIALHALADAEVVDPACAQVEVALANLRRVGSDWANAESPTGKTVERGRCPGVVVHLLDPAFDKADAQAVLESFDGQHLQVGQDAVLIMRCVILRIEFHLPDTGQFNVVLRNNLCVVQPPVCLRINPVGPAPHFSLPNKGSVALG